MAMDSGEIDTLIAGLDHPDKPTLRAAVDRLIPLARQSETLRARLDARLTAPGHKYYWPAAYVLGHLPQPSAQTVNALLAALDHQEPDIRWANALLLTAIAKREPAAIALLIELCASGTANQKRMAIYCLRDLGLNDVESLRAIAGQLSDANPTVRVAAVTSLKQRADADEAAEQALLQCYFNDADERVRHAAAITLAAHGCRKEEFVAALDRASASGHAQTKKAALAALKLLQK